MSLLHPTKPNILENIDSQFHSTYKEKLDTQDEERLD
jgi:hypothetical protein